MKQPKFKIGDKVEFVFDDAGSPIADEWEDSNKKGEGIIVAYISRGDYIYNHAVKVTKPEDWTMGHHCGGGLLSGQDARKGWWFLEPALRPADSGRKIVFPTTKPKPPSITESDHAKLYRLFAQEKPDPNNPTPICPDCFSPTTRPVRTIYCTKCEWKTEP